MTFREAKTDASPEMLRRLIEECQKNPWLKTGGIEFEDDPYMEADYQFCLWVYEDLAPLAEFFNHGNWSIRAGVQWRDLIFVNQVNGGDEWLTIKVTADKLVAFESITMRRVIAKGEYPRIMEAMHKATVEQCKRLEYMDAWPTPKLTFTG